MTIQKLKKELAISNDDIAKLFGLNYNSYANSSAKKKYEKALCHFYELVKKSLSPRAL